jgi:hypothetical protein
MNTDLPHFCEHIPSKDALRLAVLQPPPVLAADRKICWRPQRDKVTTLMVSIDEYQAAQIQRFERALA